MQYYFAWLANMFFIFALGTWVINSLSNNTKFVDKLISYQQENELGEQLYQQEFLSGQSGRLVSDQVTRNQIQAILNLLESHLDDHNYDYTVDIIDTNQVNAFSVPGGHIFFFSQMFDILDEPEEFLAVLAHEMGHNENRHQVKRMVKQYGENILINLTPTNLNLILGNLESLHYSREQEDQADEFAFQLMVKSGVHPKYFAYVMKSLDSLTQTMDIEIPDILSDHPNTEAREQRALNYPVPADFVEISDTLNWNNFLDNLQEVSKFYKRSSN